MEDVDVFAQDRGHDFHGASAVGKVVRCPRLIRVEHFGDIILGLLGSCGHFGLGRDQHAVRQDITRLAEVVARRVMADRGNRLALYGGGV